MKTHFAIIRTKKEPKGKAIGGYEKLGDALDKVAETTDTKKDEIRVTKDGDCWRGKITKSPELGPVEIEVWESTHQK